ncbi:hypothetical protein [Nesterenkonia suensis]
MAVIKTKALRDRRPKSEDIIVETTQGRQIKFLSPLKRKGHDGLDTLQKMADAEASEDIRALFEMLAENGLDDLEKFFEDDDASLEDLLDVIQEVSKVIQEQAGSLGESKA